MKKAPGCSFSIRNPGKKCFLQDLAQCLSCWWTSYWIYHCLEVYSCCTYFFLPLQQRNAPERFYVGSWQKKREVGCSKILSSESTGTAEINRELKYRKIPKISPSKYKPPQTSNAKNPALNCPSKYKPRGLVLGKLPSNTK